MRKFKVGLHYTETGHTVVKANTAFEAEEKIERTLEKDGTNNLDIKQTDREYGVTDVISLEIDLFEKK